MDDDPRVVGCIVRQDRAGRVGRAVVDRDELEVGEGLSEDTLHGLSEVALPVVDGQDNRHRR